MMAVVMKEQIGSRTCNCRHKYRIYIDLTSLTHRCIPSSQKTRNSLAFKSPRERYVSLKDEIVRGKMFCKICLSLKANMRRENNSFLTGKILQEIHSFLVLKIPQEMHAYFRGKMFCKIYLSLKANMHRERDSFLTGKILQEIHRFLALEIPQEMHASLKGKMRCETCAFLKVKSH